MRIPPAGAVRALPLVVLATLSALGCLVDRSGAPSPAVSLAIHGQVIGFAPAASGDPAIRISVFYRRLDGTQIILPSAPAQIAVTRGATTTQPVTVDVGSCLRDALRAPQGVLGCGLAVALVLLDDNGLPVDSEATFLDGSATPGKTVQFPPFTLAVPDSVRLITQGFRGPANGPPVVLSAIVYDANGSLPNRHPLQWSSSAPQVATATSLGGDSARVDFVSIGTAFIRVTAGPVSDSTTVSVFGAGTVAGRPMPASAKRAAR